MSIAPIKRVAVIGAGPAGAIAVDALAQEKTFDLIRVFERRERAGGCWSVASDRAEFARAVLTHFQDW